MAVVSTSTSTFGQRFTPNAVNQPYKVLICSNDGGGAKVAGGITVEAWLPEEVNLDISATYEPPFAQGLNGMMPGIGAAAKALGVNLTTQAMSAQVWQGGSDVQFSLTLVFQAETNSYTDVILPIKKLLQLTMPKDPTGGGLLEAPGPHVNIDKLKTPIGSQSSPGTPDPQKPSASNSGGGGLSGIVSSAKNIGSSMASSASSAVSSVTNAAGSVVSGVSGAVSGAYNSLSSGGLTGAAIDATVGSAKALKAGANGALVALSNQMVNAIEGNISLYIGKFIYIPCVVITDVSPTFNVILSADGNPTRASVAVTFKMLYIPTQADLDTMFSNTGGSPSQAKVP